MIGSNDVISHAITLLQEINKNIAGVVKAPVTPPANITQSKLPMAQVWEGEFDMSGQTGLETLTGNLIIEFLMFPATYGVLKESNFQATREMGGRFLDTYAALKNDVQDYVLDFGQESEIRVQLDRTQSIKYSGADSAMAVMSDVFYYGFRLSVPMIIRWGSDLL